MTDNQFVTDLYNLWMVAASDLPGIAKRTAGANQVISGGSNDAATFEQSTTLHGVAGGHDVHLRGASPIYAHWDKLRDEFQNILADTTTNLYDTAAVLMQVMEAYAATDAAARRELNDKIDQTRARAASSGDVADKYDLYDLNNRPQVTRAQ